MENPNKKEQPNTYNNTTKIVVPPGLEYFKQVVIQGQALTIYKHIGTPKDIVGYYTTFNGKYVISYKAINKLDMDIVGLENTLEALKIVSVWPDL